VIIDFHTHVFPEAMAAKTLTLLGNNAKLTPFVDGTLNGLKESMKKAGVTYSVTLPIATKPSQFQSINRFAAESNGKDGIIAFGGIHPKSENFKEELDQIKALGLKGIKLHPDYQGVFVDDESTYPLLEYAAKLGLIIVFHAGLDLGVPGEIKCTPKRAKKMLHAIGYSKMVLAHTGGHACWEDVAEHLAGEDVYLDTSFTLGRIDPDLFRTILKKHSVHKILFATDSPWGGQAEDIAAMKAMGFDKQTLDRIFYQNAEALLGWTDESND
jgi:predicted TIM-barrel fold metal-dependent hydrolase